MYNRNCDLLSFVAEYNVSTGSSDLGQPFAVIKITYLARVGFLVVSVSKTKQRLEMLTRKTRKRLNTVCPIHERK